MKAFLKSIDCYSIDDFTALSELSIKFPLDIINNDIELIALQESLKKVCEDEAASQEDNSYNPHNLKEMTCYEKCALFVLQTGRLMKAEFYKDFVMFVVYYLKCLNTYGYELLKPSNQNSQNRLAFCAQQDITIAPELANSLLVTFFPDNYEKLTQGISL